MCSIRTCAQTGGGTAILGNTQSSAGHSPELPILNTDSWSWPHCEQEVGPGDLQRKGPFSPEFFYDSNVPHDMCAKILRALHHWCQASATLSSAGTLPSWLKYCTSCLNAIKKGTWQFLCISISLVPCTLTFKTSWVGGLFSTQFKICVELARFIVDLN